MIKSSNLPNYFLIVIHMNFILLVFSNLIFFIFKRCEKSKETPLICSIILQTTLSNNKMDTNTNTLTVGKTTKIEKQVLKTLPKPMDFFLYVEMPKRINSIGKLIINPSIVKDLAFTKETVTIVAVGDSLKEKYKIGDELLLRKEFRRDQNGEFAQMIVVDYIPVYDSEELDENNKPIATMYAVVDEGCIIGIYEQNI